MLLQAQNHLARHSSDLEVAEQLLQHSQGTRDEGFATIDMAPNPSLGTDLETQASTHMESQSGQEIASEHLQNDDLLRLQEYNSEAPYAPMNNSPALGQVCR